MKDDKNGLPAFRPDDFVCFAIYTAGHTFNRVYKPLLKTLGLTYPQYITMVALWASDDQTVGSLCETLFLESNTLTPLLKRLETLGYIKRQRDKKDERQVRVSLTTSGSRLRDAARDFPACVDAATGFSSEKLSALKADILEVRTNLLKRS